MWSWFSRKKSVPESSVKKIAGDEQGEITIETDHQMLKCRARGPATLKNNGDRFTITGGPIDVLRGGSWFCPKKINYASFTTEHPKQVESIAQGDATLDLGMMGRYEKDTLFKCIKKENVITCAADIDGVHFTANYQKTSP